MNTGKALKNAASIVKSKRTENHEKQWVWFGKIRKKKAERDCRWGRGIGAVI
jgi:hypothetical protein